MNVLIVDDEEVLVIGLKKSLVQEGFNVLTAADGQSALMLLSSRSVDLILLDLMLPKIDGMTLCRKIREKSDTPIIMLTARDDMIDKVMGLEYGADDYITKPFNTRELIARMRSVLRRTTGEKRTSDVIEHGPVRIDTARRTVFLGAKEIELTAREFDILRVLAEHPGFVYTRDQLCELVWQEEFFDSRNIDVHVSRLREKLEADPKKPELILTRWGVGYYFRGSAYSGGE